MLSLKLLTYYCLKVTFAPLIFTSPLLMKNRMLPCANFARIMKKL